MQGEYIVRWTSESLIAQGGYPSVIQVIPEGNVAPYVTGVEMQQGRAKGFAHHILDEQDAGLIVEE